MICSNWIKRLYLISNQEFKYLDYDYPHFSRRAATEFLAWSVQQGKTYQWFKKFKPALISLETTIGRETSEVPAMIATGCNAMMRQLAETKVWNR